MYSKDLYEKKVLIDKEFPVQLQLRKIYQKGKYVDEHWHEHIELLYFTEGETDVEINRKSIHAKVGDLVVINGSELHSCYSENMPISVIVVCFEMSALSSELAEKHIIFQSLIESDKEIARIMRCMESENNRRELGYKLSCKGYLLQLVTYLCREYALEILTDNEGAKRKKNLERMNTVIHYIEEHYPEDITTEELAEQVHLSEGRFSHLFKEMVGMSPLQYINEVRMKKAHKLLENRALSITEVASLVGIPNYGYFGRLYKRYYGFAPGEQRKQF